MRARGVATWGDSEDAFTAVPEALALHGVCERGGLIRGGVVGGSAPGGEAGGEGPGLPRIFHRGGSAPGGEASANSLMSKVSLGVMECRGGVAGPGSPSAASTLSARCLWAGIGDVGGSPARAPRAIFPHEISVDSSHFTSTQQAQTSQVKSSQVKSRQSNGLQITHKSQTRTGHTRGYGYMYLLSAVSDRLAPQFRPTPSAPRTPLFERARPP